MKVTFLGTGTSIGVPAIGCTCEVCRSNDPRDKRLRCSVLLETDKGLRILIDCGPDFRQQIMNRFGKIDAVLSDDAPAKHMARKNPSLRILNEVFKEESYAGIVAKENMGLLDSVNIALIQMRAMGVYDSIFDSYIGGQIKYEVHVDSVDGPVLRVATNADFPPFEFRCKKRGVVGIDIEIARYVANYLGRNLDIIDMDFDDIIDSVRAGSADLGLAAFSVTEERSQIINFTDHYATSKIVVMVRSGEEESTFQRIKDTLLGG